MITKSIEIKLPRGLEARPVAELVQLASKYDSTVHIEAQSKKVNAKSIMGMMTQACLPVRRLRLLQREVMRSLQLQILRSSFRDHRNNPINKKSPIKGRMPGKLPYLAYYEKVFVWYCLNSSDNIILTS